MAPQTSIPLAANVLGTIGTVFWCVQLLPQIWYNWKQKKTDGLPGLMMFLWAICMPATLILFQCCSYNNSGCSLRRLCHHTEFQYPNPDPAPDILHAFARQLGPDTPL